MFVSNANRMNPLEAKRGKFAPDAPITPKFYQYHGRLCYSTLLFLIPGLCTMNSSIKVFVTAFG